MNEDQQHQPLLQALDLALRTLGAEVLAGDEEQVTVGYQELELNLAWTALGAHLVGEPAGWPNALADAILDQAMVARGSDDTWYQVQARALPVVLSQDSARHLARRAGEVLVYPYAGDLLVAVTYALAGGRRFMLRPELDTWRVGGHTVLAQAVGNLHEATPPECVRPLEDGLYALDVEDGLDASRLLVLSEAWPAGAITGVIAAVPAREMLAFVPFTRSGAQHLRALLNLAVNGFHNWTQPIAQDLFYVRGRQVLRLHVKLDDQGAPRLDLPRELVQIQAELASSGAWTQAGEPR